MIFAYALFAFSLVFDMITKIPIIRSKLFSPSSNNMSFINNYHSDSPITDQLLNIASTQRVSGEIYKMSYSPSDTFSMISCLMIGDISEFIVLA